jgi:hypothetical protein
MRICFNPLPEERRPTSATASFSASWARDVNSRVQISQTIERWRRGIRSSA